MDNLQESFGRLSTSAQEWRPQQQQQQQHHNMNQHYHLHQQQQQQQQQFGSYGQQQQPLQPPQYGYQQGQNHLNVPQSIPTYQQQPPQKQVAPQSQPQPSKQQNQNQRSEWYNATDSDLNAVSVKEFIPGKGWISNASERSTSASSSTAVWGSPTSSRATSQTRQVSHGSSTDNNNFYGYGNENEEISTQLDNNHNDNTIYATTIPSGPMPVPRPTMAYRSLHSMGMSDEHWRYHRSIQLESIRQMEPSDPRHNAVPMPYCNAFCLDQTTTLTSSPTFGYPSSTFQVTSREDGYLYCLRRIDNVKTISPKIAASIMERWKPIQDHAGICTMHTCFVAPRVVFFVHDFIPGARSLRERLSGPLSETVLWSIMSQFVSIIRRVHTHHHTQQPHSQHSTPLAIRTMDLGHILSKTDATQSKLRIYINCLGILDGLEFENSRPAPPGNNNVVSKAEMFQQEDIRNLGRVMLSLATGTEITASTDPDTFHRCDRYCFANNSREFHNLCLTLIRSSVPPAILDIARAMPGRMVQELNSTLTQMDTMERALSAEYESGRILRLLLKLGFVNERPEFGPNRRWSQTGDCYVLTLFRDYVFHQADGAGNPIMDLGHVINTLNKLDAADEEKIVLCSRDGKSVMVVTYADVARCLDNAYHELCAGSVPPPNAVAASLPVHY